MKPGGGGKMPGKLEKRIVADLGSVDKMEEDFIQAGVGQFGSGWCWLAVKDGKIVVMKTPNGENPLVHGAAAHPGLRCVGALLLYRLPQPAARLPQGVPGSSGQLGACRADARGRRKSQVDGGMTRAAASVARRRPPFLAFSFSIQPSEVRS